MSRRWKKPHAKNKLEISVSNIISKAGLQSTTLELNLKRYNAESFWHKLFLQVNKFLRMTGYFWECLFSLQIPSFKLLFTSENPRLYYGNSA